MKLFIALTFAIAAIINAPVSCAHALGMESGNAAHHGSDEHVDMMSDDAHAGHHQDTDRQAASDETPHQGCDNDCNGGAECEGCAIGATAIFAQAGEPANAAPAIALAGLSENHDSAVFNADPPPPRIL